MSNRNQRKAVARIAAVKHPETRSFIKAADDANAVANQLVKILLQPTGIKPGTELPLKSERLKQLYLEDFNIPDYNYWFRGELRLNELESTFMRYRKLSLRNFQEEKYGEPSPRLPVEYGVGSWSRIRSFCRENNRNFHTLVNQYLPLKDSIYAGNVVLISDDEYLISYIEGHGTPRSVDDPNDRTTINFVKDRYCNRKNDTPPYLLRIVEDLRRFQYWMRPITVEFSVYPEPVGLMQREEIFWEWRGGSEQDVITLAQKIVRQSTAHNLKIQIS